MRTRAFSLIELLVVIAIIMILAVSVLASIRPTGDQAKIEEVTNEVASFIRAARQNATTILEHPDRPGRYPSYGVNFNRSTQEDFSRQVIMYAVCQNELDTNNNNRIEYTDTGFHFKPTACDGGSVIEVLELKHGMRVTGITHQGPSATTAWTHFNILFIRPEPSVWFAARSGNPPSSSAVANHTVLDVGTVFITIENAPGTLSRTISVNSVGFVTIEQ